jgi:hypothetical protein
MRPARPASLIRLAPLKLPPRSLLAFFTLAALGCTPPQGNGPGEAPTGSETGSVVTVAAVEVAERKACDDRVAALTKDARPYGSGLLEQNRERFLGRARGATTLFVREPKPTAISDKVVAASLERFKKDPPGIRVNRLVARHKNDRPGLRAIVLREGYLYADAPEDAYELESKVKLADLFDDERIVLERGEESWELERKPGSKLRETAYVFTDGARAGKNANLLFGDRVRVKGEAAAPALSRDILAFARREGFDRMDVKRVGEGALLATLHIGDATLDTVVDASGAKLSIGCVAEPAEKLALAAQRLEASAWRRRAESRMRDAVGEQVDEVLPFDRPREEKGPDKDGTLRPHWLAAYKRGSHSFEYEEQTYPVFFPDGRPATPQVCVDFVLDTFERAAGSWYVPRGEKRERVPGRLDIDSFGIENRRGVLGFGEFAATHAELFDVRKFVGNERIQFAKRDAFFAFMVEHRDDFRAGDVLAIHGIKRDERVHQHAILLEYTDPITGFPSGLADQMKAPRRRSWEGIMAEAPKRSLLYRARPSDVVFKPLNDGAPPPQTALASVR